jgi:hypothetical protein
MPLPDQLFFGFPIHIDFTPFYLSLRAAASSCFLSLGKIKVSGMKGFPRIALAQLVL